MSSDGMRIIYYSLSAISRRAISSANRGKFIVILSISIPAAGICWEYFVHQYGK